MSQPLHTGPKVIDSCLTADWLPRRSDGVCEDCGGTGNQTAAWVADGIPFKTELDDTPCDSCGGTGIELDYDRYPETLQAMREEHRGDQL